MLFERPVQRLLRSVCRCSQVSGQLSGKESRKSMQNTLWMQKKCTCGVCVLHTCVYICQAKDLNSCFQYEINVNVNSVNAVLGRLFLQSDWNLFFTLLLQGRVEGLPPQPSWDFWHGAFMYLNTCTCTPPHIYSHALLLFLCLLKGAVSYIEKYLK